MSDTGAPPALDERIASTTADERAVLQALAVGWVVRTRKWLQDYLRALESHHSRGRYFTPEDIHAALRSLVRLGLAVESPKLQGHWQAHPDVRALLYARVLDFEQRQVLRRALCEAESFNESNQWATFPNEAAALSILRFDLHLGRPLAELKRHEQASRWLNVNWPDLLLAAGFDGYEPELFYRLAPDVQREIAGRLIWMLDHYWSPAGRPMIAVARELIRRPDPNPKLLWNNLRIRLALVEHEILAGRMADARALLDEPSGDDRYTVRERSPVYYAMFEAVLGAVAGRFSDAARAFEPVLKDLRQLTGRRKELMPETLAWLYPASLLSEATPARQALALKYCQSEAGKKVATPESAAGAFSLAIQMRAGDVPFSLSPFAAQSSAQRIYSMDLWNWLARAWLTDARSRKPLGARERDAAQVLRARLVACDLGWFASQLDAALAAISGSTTDVPFFVPTAQEPWRLVLTSLSALADEDSGNAQESSAEVRRVIWRIALNERGRLREIVPFEQKRGARGWGAPKAMALSRLAKTDELGAVDLKVARALRKLPHGANQYQLEMSGAIKALIGHPHVEFDDAPGQFVELVDAPPTLDVAARNDGLALRITPTIHDESKDDDDTAMWLRYGSASARELDALRLITVVRDSAQRARVIRLSPAQRRAAQLIGEQLSVPANAAAEMRQALKSLAGHFEIHTDSRASESLGSVSADGGEPIAREVEADPRLRAELTPQGSSLLLRLVAVPLGPEGPRVPPGSGRARFMAMVKGERLQAQRDLQAERAHLRAALDALSELDADLTEWLIEDPQLALQAVERLPGLPGIAGVDWPKGKPVSVITLPDSAVRVQVSSGRNWFSVAGDVQVDEREVIKLSQLLEWTAQAKGRYVPIGDGKYLALTRELRQRLDDLGSVAEVHGAEARVPLLAAAFLEATTEGLRVEADARFRARLDRLSAARDATPALPSGLQTTLRPYQEEGYVWAMRLAQSGFGACLADDMGLGKTLQALAVLLARAPGGPALVIAPTSLCGNWLAEARRFAPALNVRIYGDDTNLEAAGAAGAAAANGTAGATAATGATGATVASGRTALLERAGPFDLVLVSYGLAQRAAEAFAKIDWHTLIVDEAQAIKNASAKRSQAVFDLPADFRLALSGTPIENRLAELWSIMRFCNPGLLGSATRFGERFGQPIERDRNREAQRLLRRLIAPFVLRRTKSQVLEDLPARTETQILVTLERDEAAHYEALRRQSLEDAENHSAEDNAGQARMHVLAQLTRLRRAACDPRLVSPGIGYSGAKVRAFAELASELVANQHKVLVFSQFVDFLGLLREPLDEAGIRYQYLDGSTPAAERTRRVAAFQAGEGDLFLISLKAGGFGLNLTAADYVVIADPWWNPAAEDQAMGRAHRMGQQRPVTVYRLVSKGTLEEGIVALHHDKRALAEGVLEGAEGAGAPSTEDLIALIRGEGAASVDPAA